VDIYFSNLNRTEIYKLPCLPEAMPELSKSSKNEEFETYNEGVYNIIGNKGLTSFTIDCWLPEYPNKYKWAKSQINPYLLINMWEAAMTTKKPLRCIMVRGENKNNISPIILNWMVTVENYTQQIDGFNDIKYKLDLKEYRSLNLEKDTITIVDSVKFATNTIASKLKDIFK
jgi:hypothetical protein